MNQDKPGKSTPAPDEKKADDLAETLDETVGSERRGENVRRRRKGPAKPLPANFCGSERRKAPDRRSAAERRQAIDRRLGLPRRADDRKEFERRIEDGELTLEEIEFIRAVDKYKRKYNRPFPTWTEVMAIVKELGYVKAPVD